MIQTFRTLKYRNYRLYFSGQFISLVGSWIQVIAMGWLVYSLTGSSLILGTVGFLSRIPTFFLAPFAGVIVDRFDKYKLLLLSQIAAMLQASVLAALVFTNTITVWHIFVLGVISGLINALDMPVRQAFAIELIENREDLSNVIALNSLLMNITRLIGPTIAGVLVAVFGEGWCFMINAISFIAIIGGLIIMKIEKREATVSKKSAGKEFKEGIKYAFNFLPIRMSLFMIALISLMGMSYQVFMPVFAKDILHGGPHLLGYLMAAISVGAITGGVYLASRKSVLGLERIICIAPSIFGVGVILFALSTSVYLSFLALAITGFGMMATITSGNTLLQTLVEDSKRGRVMSYYTVAFMGTVPFGNLFSGVVSNYIGVPLTVFWGGVLCIIGSIYFFINLKKITALANPIIREKELFVEEHI